MIHPLNGGALSSEFGLPSRAFNHSSDFNASESWSLIIYVHNGFNPAINCLNQKNNVYVLDFRSINITLHDLNLPRCDEVILFETNIKVTMDSSERDIKRPNQPVKIEQLTLYQLHSRKLRWNPHFWLLEDDFLFEMWFSGEPCVSFRVSFLMISSGVSNTPQV